MNNAAIDRVLQVMLSFKENISDLHFYVGRPPQIEVSGNLLPVPIKGLERLTPYQVDVIAMSIMGNERDALRRFVKVGSADFSYSIASVSRFRVNVYKQRGTLACVMRVIPFGIPSIKELQLPETLYEVADVRNGIVLVTGPTGSGKSTTIAAIVEEINAKYPYHIVTIEDPIEYLYRHKSASICQRELGADTTSFAIALRAALRQSPKVIVVGEMRDLETAEIAIEAAETGHLVFSTLHTIDASKAIDRILGVFPQSEEQAVRNRFAQVFRYVIAQRLVPKKGGGRIATVEILKSTPRTREYILKGEGENRSLQDAMNDGYLEGMQSFDKDLERMVRTSIIEKDIALRYATNANDLALALKTMPTEEQISIVWQELVDKNDLTASDIMRIPDAIEQMKEEVSEDEIDIVVHKVLASLETDDERIKMSVLSVLHGLVANLSTLPRLKNFPGEANELVARCYQQETEEEVLFAYLGYFLNQFTLLYNSRKIAEAMEIIKTLNLQFAENDRLRRQLAMSLDQFKTAFVADIRAGNEGADAAVEFLRACGEKGMDFVFDWLVEEEDRFTRVRLLNYFDRFDPENVAPQIEKRLTDYRWYVVRNMVTILTKVNLPETSDFLQQVVSHEDPRVAKEIIKRLYQSTSREDIPTIQFLLNHSDKTVRIQAVHLVPIVKLQTAVPLLLKYASSAATTDTDLRAGSLQALAKMGVVDAVSIAQKILEKKAGSKLDIPERNAAVKVLGELAVSTQKGLLQKIAMADANPETREAASVYLK
jgi:twitching motility protein PilT